MLFAFSFPGFDLDQPAPAVAIAGKKARHPVGFSISCRSPDCY
jgi:hypothetical protein